MCPTDNAPRLTQAERVAISDKKMLQAATELLLEFGTEKITLKEVGERAGYSRGLASARFGCKEELYIRIMDAHRELWFSTLIRHTEGMTGLDAILHRVDAIEAIIVENPENVKVMYTLWFDALGHPSVLRNELLRYNTESRNSLTRILLQGIAEGEFSPELDIQQFVTDFYSRVYGMIYQWLVTPELVDVSKSMSTLKGFCRSSLAKPASA